MFRAAMLAFCLLAATLGGATAQGARVALIVGVSNYVHAPRLPNTLNDAQDMAEALKKVGFDVDLVLDPDRNALEAAVRRLGQRSVGAATSLFFYSGHALEYGGHNWLAPTTANFDTGRNVRFEALDMDSILEQTSDNARVTLVMLDACRDNPFLSRLAGRSREAATRGLARIESAASGMLIAFATAPGQVAADGTGRNSPFTSALLKQMRTPGLEIKTLMTNVTRDVVQETNGRQRPWQNSSLEGDFYFVPAPAAPAVSTPPAPRPQPPAVDTEIIFWNSISASRDPADFTAYLDRFPQGVFAALARNRLNQIAAAAKPATPPAAPNVATTNRTDAPAASSPAAPAPAQVAVVAPPSTLHDKLLASLTAAAPNWQQSLREADVANYVKASGSKALAFSPDISMTWRSGDRKDAVAAASAALESCQVFAGKPCVLLATNDMVENPIGPSGLPARDMAHVGWSGKFRPEFVPGLPSNLWGRADIAGYSAAQGAKAAAYHPGGRLYIKTGASQKQAEEDAIAACLADPVNGSTKKCFLYAVGDWVILPQRLPAARPTPTTLKEALTYLRLPLSRLTDYEKYKSQKAMAIDRASLRVWRSSGLKTPEEAEQIALEGCAMQYGENCVLLAVNDELKTPDVFTAPARSTPRLAYAGAYDPAKVPSFASPARAEFVNYAKMPAPKAMAIRSGGSKVAIARGKDKVEAQTKALAACTAPDDPYPCFVYAIDNQVVLAQRKPEPIK